jgi:hypothetical protein
VGRCEVADQGAWTAGKYGGHAACLEAGGVVTQAVDAVVNGEEPAVGKPPLDLAAGDAGAKKLPSRHHPVLPRGDP